MTPLKTCLLIEAPQVVQLVIDGPALRIALEAQSARLFPLRRIARIHVLGTLNQGHDTLIRCAERQIAVAFFTLNGRLRCQLYYPTLEQTPISHWLEHCEFDRDVRQTYQDWLLHQSLALLAQTGFKRGCSEQRLQQAEHKQTQMARTLLGEQQQLHAWQWLDGLITVQLTQLLAQYGFAHPSRAKRQLVADVVPLLNFWARTQYLIWQQRAPTAVSGRSITQFYHAHNDALDTLAQRMLCQLASRLEAII